MARITAAITALAVALALTSCETTNTYVKDDASIPGAAAAGAGTEAQGGQGIESKAEAPAAESVNPAQDIRLDGNTVAVIGKYVLTKEKYRILQKYMEEKYNYKLPGDMEREFVDYIVNKKLMALEARSLGYAERTDVRVKYEWDFDDTVSHDYFEEMIEKKSEVTPGEARKYYEANKEDFVEIKAQHILVKNKSMAENIYKRLLSGESFDELAKKYSEDETTKAQGGSLGFFTKDVMVREFEDAAFSTAAGETTQPVKSIYGYHIIKVLERRKISFDDSKDRIMTLIKNKKKKGLFDSTIEELTKKYGAKVNTDLIK